MGPGRGEEEWGTLLLFGGGGEPGDGVGAGEGGVPGAGGRSGSLKIRPIIKMIKKLIIIIIKIT